MLTNIVSAGFKGVVYPVNPEFEAVMAMPCFPDLKSLPRTPDLAVICTMPSEVPDKVRECGETGINGVIIMSSGRITSYNVCYTKLLRISAVALIVSYHCDPCVIGRIRNNFV